MRPRRQSSAMASCAMAGVSEADGPAAAPDRFGETSCRPGGSFPRARPRAQRAHPSREPVFAARPLYGGYLPNQRYDSDPADLKAPLCGLVYVPEVPKVLCPKLWLG